MVFLMKNKRFKSLIFLNRFYLDHTDFLFYVLIVLFMILFSLITLIFYLNISVYIKWVKESQHYLK